MHDVLIIGGGLAGWRAAEAAVKAGASVALVANGAGNSPDIHALNVPVGPGDSVGLFIDDTLRSGRGGSDETPSSAKTPGASAVNEHKRHDSTKKRKRKGTGVFIRNTL